MQSAADNRQETQQLSSLHTGHKEGGGGRRGGGGQGGGWGEHGESMRERDANASPLKKSQSAVMNQMTHLQISNDVSNDIHLHCPATQISQALLIPLDEVSVVVIRFRAMSHGECISRLVVPQHGDAFLAGPVQDS